jgi:hypothetical protein
MRSRVTLLHHHAKIELEMPWELAEAFVSVAPQIIDQLRTGLEASRRKAESRARSDQLHHDAREERGKRYDRIGRDADRFARRHNANGYASEYLAMKAFAVENGLTTPMAMQMLRRYRRFRNERIKARQLVHIIKLHLLGYTHGQIARRLRPMRRVDWVGAEIRKHRDLIADLRRFEVQYHGEKIAEARQKAASEAPDEIPAIETLEQRKARHAALSVQLYRHYRRVVATGSKPDAIFKRLATECELPGIYVEQLVKQRMAKVQAFVKARRDRFALELHAAGHTQSVIATRIGKSQPYVSHLLRTSRGGAK